jgi:hypothetical protein
MRSAFHAASALPMLVRLSITRGPTVRNAVFSAQNRSGGSYTAARPSIQPAACGLGRGLHASIMAASGCARRCDQRGNLNARGPLGPVLKLISGSEGR